MRSYRPVYAACKRLMLAILVLIILMYLQPHKPSESLVCGISVLLLFKPEHVMGFFLKAWLVSNRDDGSG